MARKDVQLIQLANQAADFFAFSASFLLGGATQGQVTEKELMNVGNERVA